MGSSSARRESGAGESAEGLRETGPWQGRATRRSTRTWIELTSIPPAVQSLGPAPTSPLSPSTGSQAPVRGGLPGLRWRRLWAPGSLPCRQPGRPALLHFLPPSPVRSWEAGSHLPEPSASCLSCPDLRVRRRATELGRGPQGAFFSRRADHAALPWLQAATAGEAGTRTAGRRRGTVRLAPPLRELDRGAQDGAGPGSELSSGETNNSSRGERSPSEPPAARARRAPAPGRSRPAFLPALLPHM